MDPFSFSFFFSSSLHSSSSSESSLHGLQILHCPRLDTPSHSSPAKKGKERKKGLRDASQSLIWLLDNDELSATHSPLSSCCP